MIQVAIDVIPRMMLRGVIECPAAPSTVLPLDLRSPMTENSNIETAHRLAEHGDGKRPRPAGGVWEEWVEVGEAISLALVAIATAWSGYQASQWEGRQAELYGESQELRIDADELLTLGGQRHLRDIMTFNTWIQRGPPARIPLPT